MSKYTRENMVEGIDNKFKKIALARPELKPFCESYRTTILNYPIEIEQNVLEWVNDLPLTHVDCHGISVKEVMEDYDLPDHFFLVVVRNFIMFKNDGFVGTATCCLGL